MVNVFSFSLFGSQDKYCKGLLKNLDIISKNYPDWETWIYLGDNIPTQIIETLRPNENVKLIYTNIIGNENKIYRYFPIDNLLVDICIIRDADSRIYDRDISCINDFVESDALFHIIRDHPNHFHKIMAGMWGIKRNLLQISIEQLYKCWRYKNNVNDFWADTSFLCEVIYPMVIHNALIHDELHNMESDTIKLKARIPVRDELHFIGQVYEYDEHGKEYPKFPYHNNY
jgi:hypothetical protein